MNKKTALITGASSGLGRELARIHAERGGNLVIVARREEKLQALKQELQSKYGTETLILAKDLSRPEAPQEIYDAVKTAGIRIDYLINNAGFGGQGYFHARTMEQDLQMIAVNIIALAKLTKLFLPDFIKRGNGRILNVSSTAALMPGPLQAVYYATKAYVTAMDDAIWREIRGTGVTITTLMPGGMDTGFARASSLEGTQLASAMVFSPRVVAEDGYAAMLRGEMEVISKLSFLQKILFKLLPLVPKKTLMNRIFSMQKQGSSPV